VRSATKYLLSILFILALNWGGTACAVDAPHGAAVPAPDIELFVRDGCPHCAKAEEFLSKLQHEQPGLHIIIRDVSREPAALERLQHVASQQRVMPRVPAFVIGEQLIVGYSEEASTDKLIRDSLTHAKPPSHHVNAAAGCDAVETYTCGPDETPPAPKQESFTVDVFGYSVALDQVGLPLFTISMGLLDGFNPCSMWVLILIISLLAPMNDRPRMFAVAGTFIVVQGVAYFIFMAAWLNLFLLIGLSRISEIVIASLALLAGIINVKDFLFFGRGISLSIPAAAKPGIYTRMRHVLQADNLSAALIGIVVLGVLVQLIELMCTSGFPALFTRILTLQQLDGMGYYAYLLLYDLAYMLDDIVILTIGIVTLSQHRLQEKEGRWLKLVSGVVMVMLGIYLLLPH
jgi:glutaredoxin